MRDMDVFAGVHSSAEEHGNDHSLPGAKVGHISFDEELAEVIILQNLVVEAFRCSLDCLMSPTSSYKFSIMASPASRKNDCKSRLGMHVHLAHILVSGFLGGVVYLILTANEWFETSRSFLRGRERFVAELRGVTCGALRTRCWF